MTTADLFSSMAAPVPGDAPGSGFLITNHLNLLYMLAAGLVMPPAGFGSKYYSDTLECFPGWIPLFLGKVPREAIESSVREAGHLKPVAVEVRLTRLSGQILVIGDDGLEERRYPDQLDGTERAILVPAPLPTDRVDSIIFQSADEKRACEGDAKDFGNVPLEEFKRKTKSTLFTKAPNTPWPLGNGPVERSVPLERPFAAGGVMAMLVLFGNLGDEAVSTCQRAFDPEVDVAGPADDHPILVGLDTWIREGTAPLPPPVDADSDRIALQRRFQARLFWEAVECLVRWREGGRAGSAEDVVLDHLARAVTVLDPRLQAGARKLHDTLDSLTGLADATASELFDRHDTSLAHALTLFFLRRDCADLFDDRSDRPEEVDWLAAAILFGVRDGWMGLPLRLRGHPGLAAAVSHRMARMSHRIAGTGLHLGEPPARVCPLRELLGGGSAWRARQRSAALELAKTQQWDCVHTRINLGPGEYKLTVKGGSTHIELPGEPKVSPEIDTARFLDLLAHARLDAKAEGKARKQLGG